MGDLIAALKIIAAHSVKKGDPAEHAARSDFQNAVRDAILSLARGENIGRGVGIRKRVGEGTFILSADVTRGGRGGSASSHPFQVIEETPELEDAAVKVLLGTVLGVVPTLSGTPLDTDPPPHLTFTEDGSVCLRVNISGMSSTFRPFIESVNVVKVDGTVIVDDDNDPIGELTMIWDDEATKINGYFFVKVAQLKVTSSLVDASAITEIGQLLMSNIYSFIIVVDDVIILS